MTEGKPINPLVRLTAWIGSVTALLAALVALRGEWRNLFPSSSPPQPVVTAPTSPSRDRPRDLPLPKPVPPPPVPVPPVAPVLPAGEITLLNGFANYDDSGFSFRQNRLVRWNSAEGDILAARQAEDDYYVHFFLPYDLPPYSGSQDDRARSGIVRIYAGDYESLSACPTGGYTYHWYEAQIDAIYCVRLRSGDRYAKARVTGLTPDRVTFEWQLLS